MKEEAEHTKGVVIRNARTGAEWGKLTEIVLPEGTGCLEPEAVQKSKKQLRLDKKHFQASRHPGGHYSQSGLLSEPPNWRIPSHKTSPGHIQKAIYDPILLESSIPVTMSVQRPNVSNELIWQITRTS
jgi:hypothetical protein